MDTFAPGQDDRILEWKVIGRSLERNELGELLLPMERLWGGVGGERIEITLDSLQGPVKLAPVEVPLAYVKYDPGRRAEIDRQSQAKAASRADYERQAQLDRQRLEAQRRAEERKSEWMYTRRELARLEGEPKPSMFVNLGTSLVVPGLPLRWTGRSGSTSTLATLTVYGLYGLAIWANDKYGKDNAAFQEAYHKAQADPLNLNKPVAPQDNRVIYWAAAGFADAIVLGWVAADTHRMTADQNQKIRELRERVELLTPLSDGRGLLGLKFVGTF
jgi:hypothetical protein